MLQEQENKIVKPTFIVLNGAKETDIDSILKRLALVRAGLLTAITIMYFVSFVANYRNHNNKTEQE